MPAWIGLTGLPYVTGTSDALNTRFIIDMMLAQDPELKKVGLLYSLSEVNSAKPIAEAIATLESRGIAYVERTANTNDEVITAVSASGCSGPPGRRWCGIGWSPYCPRPAGPAPPQWPGRSRPGRGGPSA